MNWESIFKEPHVWLDSAGPSSDVVISSRVRLARNLTDLPFPGAAQFRKDASTS